MELKDLIEAMELPADATEADVLKAARERKSSFVMYDDEARALRERVTGLERQLVAREAKSLVDEAISVKGKISPAMRGWATDYAIKDPAGFKAYVEAAPRLSIFEPEQGHGFGTRADAVELSETERKIAAQMGIDPAKVLESKQRRAGIGV